MRGGAAVRPPFLKWLTSPMYEWEFAYDPKLPSADSVTTIANPNCDTSQAAAQSSCKSSKASESANVDKCSFEESLSIIINEDDSEKALNCKEETSAGPHNRRKDRDAREEAAMTFLQCYTHMLGDRPLLSAELLCFVAAIAVGIGEGLGDDLCRERIAVGAAAATVQALFGALATIPLDFLLQTALGAVTVCIALMAVVLVNSSGAIDHRLAQSMETAGAAGNILGLAAVGIEIVAVLLRLARARRRRRRRELRRLRDYLAAGVRSHGGDKRGGGREDSLDSIEMFSSAAPGRSTANQTFQLGLHAFGGDDDLDLFLLDVEEDAARTDADVDDLALFMADAEEAPPPPLIEKQPNVEEVVAESVAAPRGALQSAAPAGRKTLAGRGKPPRRARPTPDEL